MFIYGAARLAARRAAGQNRDKMFIQPGPPLWSLMLDELAYLANLPRQRLLRFLRRLRRGGPSASVAPSPAHATNETRTTRGRPT